MIVYERNTGKIICRIPDDQEPQVFFSHYSNEFRENLEYIYSDNPTKNLKNYIVVNNEIFKRPSHEIDELRKFGHIFTDDERIEILLMPSRKEIEKAETTIELLSILEEVGLI